MTAIAIIRLEDSVSFVTDTRGTSALGHHYDVAKVRAIPHMRIAIATRGRAEKLDVVERELCWHAHDFDSARYFLGLCFAGLNLGETDVYVIGWSSEGPAAFTISSVNTESKILDLGYVTNTPVVGEAALEAFHDDPVGNAVALVQEMGRLHDSVGGAIVCTTLRETVIESCVAGLVHPPVEMKTASVPMGMATVLKAA